MLSDVIDSLTEEEAALLEPLVKKGTLPRGGILIEQFDMPEAVYIVTEGKVRLFELTVLAKNLCALQLADLAADEWNPVLLGESSVLLGQLCSCTVVATSEIEYISIPLDVYNNLKSEHPAISYKILEYMGKVLAFRFLNMQEKFSSRIVGNATNPHTALALLKKYVGNVRVCTPQMANKLFKMESPVL